MRGRLTTDERRKPSTDTGNTATPRVDVTKEIAIM